MMPMETKPVVRREPRKEITASAPSQLGAVIRTVRTVAGLSQTELAAKLKTAQADIARLEKGGGMPNTGTLHRIAKATGYKLAITFIPGA
jgi:ribosome-binding protein aMBF1 (putative translation factor)